VDGRRAPALRFGDPRVQALAGALSVSLLAVTGITNKSLRALMTGLLTAGHRPTPSPTTAARRPAHHRHPHRRPTRPGPATVGGCLTPWTSAKVLATKDR
jgi:hypothetical protein